MPSKSIEVSFPVCFLENWKWCFIDFGGLGMHSKDQRILQSVNPRVRTSYRCKWSTAPPTFRESRYLIHRFHYSRFSIHGRCGYTASGKLSEGWWGCMQPPQVSERPLNVSEKHFQFLQNTFWWSTFPTLSGGFRTPLGMEPPWMPKANFITYFS